jgi:hypothetical protein
MRTTDSLSESICYLDSRRARESLKVDPYWPKWDSPWWHMTLLWELGLARSIPESAVYGMVEILKTHYHLLMPFKNEDLPAGVDPHRGVPCHCAVGTMHQVLMACGAAVDEEVPWMRAWLLSYQLPDGGLNCFGQAYAGSRKSSIVSTLPALEAILLGTPRPFTEAEQSFLDDGARYLLNHRLFKSLSGQTINEDWLKPCFPRFYEYDVLRGLTFLARWSRLRNKDLPLPPITEAVAAVERASQDEEIIIGRLAYAGARSLDRQPDLSWKGGPAALFPLLEEVSEIGSASASLTQCWTEIRPVVAR